MKKAFVKVVRVGSAAVAAVMAASSSAFAAVDIAAATSSATTDIQTAGALIIGVVVAVAAIGWIRRVIH